MLAACYSDLGPILISLDQSSAAADANGVISGNVPEGGAISDYALIWFNGFAEYWRATGDVESVKRM